MPPTTSFSTFVGLYACLVVGYGLTAEAAFTGDRHLHTGAAVGVLVSAVFIWRARDSDYWRLPRPARREALDVTATGRPSWDPVVDLVALGLLTRAATAPRQRLGTAVFTLVFLGLPVVATVRTGEPWYLLALLPPAWRVTVAGREAAREDPRIRLARLRAATDAGPPVEIRPAGTGR